MFMKMYSRFASAHALFSLAAMEREKASKGISPSDMNQRDY
jgi:hypothetical protein